MLLEHIASIREQSLAASAEVRIMDDLDVARPEVHDKSGTPLPQVRRAIGSPPGDRRKEIGAAVASAQLEVEEALTRREQGLLDVTLPGSLALPNGSLHPRAQLPKDLKRRVRRVERRGLRRPGDLVEAVRVRQPELPGPPRPREHGHPPAELQPWQVRRRAAAPAPTARLHRLVLHARARAAVPVRLPGPGVSQRERRRPP